ncbi:globin CTT-VI [Teleopsis dalmanni]|uniref:globin CTT-VI n=1 Tax=Teleopsis dalmanni TaxID=139649 RepID=UPI0018CF35FC|nr:globin CTT-VI [Teleopsis dalmanni]XP_037954587.1 globin CTT-VI [Teleopsis dalmanni]XP_037954588.1 globin CTT-VI [Teleopsis dalmanni]XP_037954589.1 globin CTT-VI [Teleopsis dalmanni]
MNPEEIHQIKKTWEIPMENPAESGAAILLQFFTKYPSNLQKFSAFKDSPIPELPNNPRFKAHAVRIIRVFDDSIQLLGYDVAAEKLEEMWSKIATSHFHRQIQRQSFNELKEVILEVLTAACSLNEQQIAAWSKLMDIVYSIVFQKLDKLESGEQ